jgi:hypothetical protein
MEWYRVRDAKYTNSHGGNAGMEMGWMECPRMGCPSQLLVVLLRPGPVPTMFIHKNAGHILPSTLCSASSHTASLGCIGDSGREILLDTIKVHASRIFLSLNSLPI